METVDAPGGGLELTVKVSKWQRGPDPYDPEGEARFWCRVTVFDKDQENGLHSGKGTYYRITCPLSTADYPETFAARIEMAVGQCVRKFILEDPE